MSKYCKFCGNLLEDNELCNCEDAKQSRMESSEQSAQVNTNDEMPNQSTINSEETAQSTEYIDDLVMNINTDHNTSNSMLRKQSIWSKLNIARKNFFPFIKGFLRSPEEAVNSAMENFDVPLAFLLSLGSMLTALLFISVTIVRFKSIVHTLLRILQLNDTLGKYIYFSLPWILLYSFVCYVVILFVTTVSIFVVSKCHQSNLKFRQTFVAASTIFIYPMIILPICTILMFFSSALTYILLSFGFITYLFLYYIVARTIGKSSDRGKSLLGNMFASFFTYILCTLFCTILVLCFARKIVYVDSQLIDDIWGEEYDNFDDYEDYGNDYYDYNYYDDYYGDDYDSDFYDFFH